MYQIKNGNPKSNNHNRGRKMSLFTTTLLKLRVNQYFIATGKRNNLAAMAFQAGRKYNRTFSIRQVKAGSTRFYVSRTT